MKRPLRVIIVLWWLSFAVTMYVAIFVRMPLGPDLWAIACLIARLLIPMRTRGMHVAAFVLFLASGMFALQVSSHAPLFGPLATLCLLGFVVLTVVSDILQFMRKPLPVGQ